MGQRQSSRPLRRLLRRLFLDHGEPPWSFLFRRADWPTALVERSLFCLALAFIAKYLLDQPLLTWLMFLVAAAYFACAVAVGERDR